MNAVAENGWAGTPRLRLVRCSCTNCGAHVVSRVLHTVGGNCQNCGSYDLQVLGQEPPAVTPAPIAPVPRLAVG